MGDRTRLGLGPTLAWVHSCSMKYYVRKDALSEIEGPFELDSIRGWIARGRFTTEHEAVEDRGRSTDEVRRSRMWRTLEEIFAEPQALHVEQSPQHFLDAVRSRSCYKTLRLCVDLAIVAAWAACALLAFVRSSDSTNSVMIAVFLAVAAAVASVAVRQSAFVVVDIADILIEQNRRK
jgi:hypothetical protein